MPYRSDCIQSIVQKAGVIYLAALVLSVTILAFFLVSQERADTENIEVTEARAQIADLKPLAAELVYARDLLAEQLIARYVAYECTETTFRRLAYDLRAARMTWRAIVLENKGSFGGQVKGEVVNRDMPKPRNKRS
jgi:hypothetical protein